MEIGISTATFFSKGQLEDNIRKASALDVDVCEVFLNTFSEYEPDFARLLVERKGKLRVHSVHSLNTHFEPMLFNVSERTRNDHEYFFRKVVDAGNILGAEAYTFHGGARMKFKSPYNYDFAWLGEVMERLCAYSQSKGIEVTFENVYWAMFNKPEFFLNLKQYSPSVKACLDIKQAERAEVPYVEYLKVIGDRLRTVHIADFCANGATCLPGTGSVDFYRLFSDLSEYGYGGPVLMELYPGDWSTLDDLSRAIEFLKNTLAKVK